VWFEVADEGQEPAGEAGFDLGQVREWVRLIEDDRAVPLRQPRHCGCTGLGGRGDRQRPHARRGRTHADDCARAAADGDT
jgi:hypothetical protein